MKKRRNNDLLAIQGKASLADHRRRIGETVEVLVEGRSKKALDFGEARGDPQAGTPATGVFPQLTGRAMTDHIVVFDGPDGLTGQTVRVHIDDASAFTLFGTAQTVDLEAACGVAVEESATRIGLPVV